MIPLNNILIDDIEETEFYDNTYNLVINKNYISGYTSGIDAVIQAIYFILNTERYKHPIYSFDYGIELYDLIGKPMSYVQSELQRRIEDALLQDDRIESCTDFEFEVVNKSTLYVTFTVNTIYGVLYSAMGVNI